MVAWIGFRDSYSSRSRQENHLDCQSAEGRRPEDCNLNLITEMWVPQKWTHKSSNSQNRLQWGRSNLVDPAGPPKICLLNRDFANDLSIFPGKTAKHRVH